MLIPVESTKLIFWRKVLYENKKKGEANLSNLLFVDSWAKPIIDDGAMVIVIYDPQTPNGAELVRILEDAGYGERALTVLFMLQLNLGSDSDWNSIVNDTALMESIFNNASARYIVFNSVDAMNAVMASATARNVLLASTDALREMWSYDFTTTTVLVNPTMFAAVAGNNNAMDALLTSSSNWGRILSQKQNISAIIGNVSFRNRALTNANACTQLFNNATAVDSVIADSAAVTYVLANASVYNAMFSSSTAMGRVIQSTSVMNLIYANNTVFTAMVNSSVAMDYIVNSSSVMDTIIANTANCAVMVTAGAACDAIFGNINASTKIANSTSAMTSIVNSDFAWSKFLSSGSAGSKAKQVFVGTSATSKLVAPIILGAGTSRMNDFLSDDGCLYHMRDLSSAFFPLIYENDAYAAWRAAIIASDKVNDNAVLSASIISGSEINLSANIPYYVGYVQVYLSGDVTGNITVTGTWKTGSPKMSRYPASGNATISQYQTFDVRGFGTGINIKVNRVSGGTIDRIGHSERDCRLR